MIGGPTGVGAVVAAQGYVGRLRDDLVSGRWDRRHGRARTQPSFEGSLVLVRVTR